eukprot:7365738-Prymnesium_polylepis.1
MRRPSGSPDALRRATLTTEPHDRRRRTPRPQTSQQLHILAIPRQHIPRSLTLLEESLLRCQTSASPAAEARHRPVPHQAVQTPAPPAARPDRARPPERVLQEAGMRSSVANRPCLPPLPWHLLPDTLVDAGIRAIQLGTRRNGGYF